MAAIVDYLSDGYSDIYLVGYGNSSGTNNPATSELWKNDGGKGFSLVQNTGLPPTTFASTAWADFDKDGFVDAFITSRDNSTSNALANAGLYRNNGGTGSFTPVPFPSGLPGIYLGNAVWADFNGDGWLDLVYAGSYTSEDTTWATNLLLNNQGTSFTAVSPTQTGLPLGTYANLAAGDFDNDNFPDLAVSISNNTEQVDMVYQNNQAAVFSLATKLAASSASTNAALIWADYNNDGKLDLYVLTMGGNNTLYQNNVTAGSNPLPPMDVRYQ